MILGVSSCLLGNMCRYDGHGAKDDFVFNSLNQFFKLQNSSRDKLLGAYQQNENGVFKVRINDGSGKHIYLGSYKTQEEAHEVYLNGKTKLGEQLADFYDGFVEDRVLEVVSDFKTWFKTDASESKSK